MPKQEILCARCDIEMKLGSIPRYEYEIGYPLHDVEAYLCPKCGKVFFTQEQAKQMKMHTEEVIRLR